MHRTPIATALLAAIFLSACDDPDSGSPAAAPTNSFSVGLDGSWSHHEGSELTKRYVFKGETFSYRSYFKKCLISEDSGSYSTLGDNLMLTPVLVHSRGYSSDAKDSSEACGNAMGTATVFGTMPLRREAVTTTSFTTVTIKFEFTESGSTTSEVRTVYTRD